MVVMGRLRDLSIWSDCRPDFKTMHRGQRNRAGVGPMWRGCKFRAGCVSPGDRFALGVDLGEAAAECYWPPVGKQFPATICPNQRA